MKYISIFCLLLGSFSITGQNFEPDASIWKEPWISCEKTINPKSEYGVTHWIQYDLGLVRRLSKSWVWNVNDPDKLDLGFREVRIDYSTNGVIWTYLDQMAFPKAAGDAVYGGFEGPDLYDVEARFILVTALSTYGDGDCAGISEIKFNLRPPFLYENEEDMPELEEKYNNALVIYPNPANDQLNIRTIYEGRANFWVFSIDGRQIFESQRTVSPNRALILDTRQLQSGMYILRVEHDGYFSTERFVVH